MPSKASSVHFLMFSCVWRSDFIAALLDPRFKKLKFKHDGMLQDRRRREALKWLSEAFNAKYKGKVKAADTSEGNAAGRAASTDAPPSAHPHEALQPAGCQPASAPPPTRPCVSRSQSRRTASGARSGGQPLAQTRNATYPRASTTWQW